MLPKARVNYESGGDFHANRRHLRAHGIRCFELAKQALGTPRSVLDVGCGEGALVGHARNLGLESMGVDLAVPTENAQWGLLHHDLRTSLDLGRRFQWVLCWEVAEHLECEYADILCDTLAVHLARPDGRLLFTAAIPGQRGAGHVNCQPRAYWRGLLEARGLVWQTEETLRLRELWGTEVPRAPWYGKNVSVMAWA